MRLQSFFARSSRLYVGIVTGASATARACAWQSKVQARTIGRGIGREGGDPDRTLLDASAMLLMKVHAGRVAKNDLKEAP